MSRQNIWSEIALIGKTEGNAKAGKPDIRLQSSNKFLKELKEAAKAGRKRNETVKIVSHDGTSLLDTGSGKDPKRSLSQCMAGVPPGAETLNDCGFLEKNDCTCCMRSSGGKVAAAVIILVWPNRRYDFPLIGSIGLNEPLGNEIPTYWAAYPWVKLQF